MWMICSQALVKVTMVKPHHLLKPVLASLVGGRHLSQQRGLPRQPVPALQQSCEHYLSILEAIVEDKELQRTKELVEEFQRAGGIGERLQRGLERKAKDTENWFTEDYVKIDYLVKRRSVVGYSNGGSVFPLMDFRDKKGQIRFAAKLTASALELKTKIDNGTLPVEYMRGNPLCMKQYEQLLSSCRIPGPEMDTQEYYNQKHITVVHNHQFFALEAYNSDGSSLTVDQLCVQLERICNCSLQTDAEPVGILTTQHRDNWSKSYMNLIKDETNRRSLSKIQSSIFIVCLDAEMPPVCDESYLSWAVHYMMHAGGSRWNAGNRWFDKGTQLIIGQNGVYGLIGANSVADGVTIMSFSNLVNSGVKNLQVKSTPAKSLDTPEKLHFNITPEIRTDIEDAKLHMDTLAQDLEVRFTVFEHFGKRYLKTLKMSPDAFVQIAMQLAHYRTYHRICAMMEPVSLRTFTLGRLSLMNVNSPASTAFVRTFDDPEILNSQKVDFLLDAVRTHVSYTDLALRGENVFCHFWGLKLQAEEENISTPEIFTDSSFQKAFNYKMAASHVPNQGGIVPSFGPEEPGVYDVVYSIMDSHMDFVVAALRSKDGDRENHATHMAQAVEDALLDMRTLLERAAAAKKFILT